MFASHPNLRVFGSPHRYIQGTDALDQLGVITASIGSSAVVIIDAAMSDMLRPRILASLDSAKVPFRWLENHDEVTHANIDRQAELVGHETPQPVVIGVGGGKTLDVARGVSWKRGTKFITVPTIASNDSPAAMAVAVYDDHHNLVEVVQTGRNPDAVVVDTALIVGAPTRFLSAGIGDALSKNFEAQSCLASGGLNQHGTLALRIAVAIGDECYRTLREFGAQALIDARAGEVTAAVEHTVEAVILMSGLTFENGGLSIAHSMMRGLTVTRGVSAALHGEHVAYGLMVQLALEGASDDRLQDLATYLKSVALPASLADLGLQDPTHEELATLVEQSLLAPHSQKTPAEVTRETLRDAVTRIETLARA